jgi:hypothetical protein
VAAAENVWLAVELIRGPDGVLYRERRTLPAQPPGRSEGGHAFQAQLDRTTGKYSRSRMTRLWPKQPRQLEF